MSGHSKWHNIQARKGKQDAVRGSHFTKISRLITLAAQKGGDPATNFSLRLAIEKAKEVSMPKDNVEKAIKRGTGELESNQIEELLYEAFGPRGVAVMIKVTTDNKNRAISDVKYMLSENGGTFGSSGSVQWMFLHLGVIEAVKPEKLDLDELEMALIDAGAEDFIEEEGLLEIKTKVENLQKIQNKLKELGVEVKEAGIRWVPKDKVVVDDGVREKLEKLFSDFENNDDVSDYYTNAD